MAAKPINTNARARSQSTTRKNPQFSPFYTQARRRFRSVHQEQTEFFTSERHVIPDNNYADQRDSKQVNPWRLVERVSALALDQTRVKFLSVCVLWVFSHTTYICYLCNSLYVWIYICVYNDQMRTAYGVLVYCLNIGIDPPNVVRTQPCASLECWTGMYALVSVYCWLSLSEERRFEICVHIYVCLHMYVYVCMCVYVRVCMYVDPFATSPRKAIKSITQKLQHQYERWQPRVIYECQPLWCVCVYDTYQRNHVCMYVCVCVIHRRDINLWKILQQKR